MLKNKNAVMISRLLVGALFIVSGLIKANDPLGFSYKLEEYFAQDVLNWSWFRGWEVGLASIVAIAEIILGFAVLAGEKFLVSAWSLLLLMIFFTFLTGYTAIGNWFFENPEAGITGAFESMLGFQAGDIHYFKDCGCFGDALQLTPFESFVKDLILLVFTVIIFVNRKAVKSNTIREDFIYYGVAMILVIIFSLGVLGWFLPVVFSLVTFGVLVLLRRFYKGVEFKGWIMGAAVLLISSWFTYYCYAHLPVKDFRPYAVGKNIEEGMTIPEGENPPKYGYIYTMKDNSSGETYDISSDDYLANDLWKNEDLEIVETSDQILLEKGYEPPIHDFVLESPDDGGNYTSYVLGAENAILVIQYDISKTATGNMNKIKSLTDEAAKKGYEVFGLTAASSVEIDEFRHQHQLAFPYLQADATMLKTIVRSNPGVVALHRGTVVGKWHHNDITNFEDLKNTSVRLKP